MTPENLFSRCSARATNGAMLGADNLAFLRELSAVLLAVLKNCDEAAGFGEKPPDGPGSEDVGFSDLPGPVEAEDAGGVVLEDRDLVGTEFDWHALRCARTGGTIKGRLLTGRLTDYLFPFSAGNTMIQVWTRIPRMLRFQSGAIGRCIWDTLGCMCLTPEGRFMIPTKK